MSTPTDGLRLELLPSGSFPTTWGDKTNANMTLLDKAIRGMVSLNVTGVSTYTLSTVNYAEDEARYHTLRAWGVQAANCEIIVPSGPNGVKMYLVKNDTTGGSYTVTIKTSAGTGVIVPRGGYKLVHMDGTNVLDVVDLSSLDGAAIKAGSIPTAALADSAITSAKIADGTIIAADIADGAITSAKILDGTISTVDLADSAVTTNKLADSSVTSAKIVDGTIATGDIANSAITTAKIADGAITAAKFGSTTPRIVAGGRANTSGLVAGHNALNVASATWSENASYGCCHVTFSSALADVDYSVDVAIFNTGGSLLAGYDFGSSARVIYTTNMTTSGFDIYFLGQSSMNNCHGWRPSGDWNFTVAKWS